MPPDTAGRGQLAEALVIEVPSHRHFFNSRRLRGDFSMTHFSGCFKQVAVFQIRSLLLNCSEERTCSCHAPVTLASSPRLGPHSTSVTFSQVLSANIRVGGQGFTTRVSGDAP